MYSQQELDDAVASGAITPDHGGRTAQVSSRASGSPLFPDEEQFRLITGFNDIFVLDRRRDPVVCGRLDRPVDRAALPSCNRRQRTFASRPAVRWRWPAWELALFFTARRRMALPMRFLPLLAFVGGVLATAGLHPWCLGVGGRLRSTTIRQLGGRDLAAVSAAVAAVAAWIPLAAIPRSDHDRHRRGIGCGNCRSSCSSPRSVRECQEQSEKRHSRLRPAARDRRVPARDVVGRIRPRPPHAPLRRRVLAAPARRANDRASGLHPARSQRRQCDGRRRAGRDPALYRFLALTAPGDRSARACSCRRWPMCCMQCSNCSASSERSSSTSR